MTAITINQAYLDRVGRLVGNIHAAQLKEQSVYEYIGVSKSTWANVKNGKASSSTNEIVLNNAERYVEGILFERRKNN